ncbi:MAG: response regulator [Chitinophagaceae bacterium]
MQPLQYGCPSIKLQLPDKYYCLCILVFNNFRKYYLVFTKEIAVMMRLSTSQVRSILVIDDDIDDFEQVAEAIKQVAPHITVYFLSKCEDAKNFFRHSIDLVLLDINMPRHDGFYWLKEIRERGYKDLPIIMYTNSTRPAHIEKAYEEGANLFFPKPDRFEQLMRGLQQLVQFNWANPFSITEKYFGNGRYAAFQP